VTEGVDDGLSELEYEEVYYRCYGCGYQFDVLETAAGLISLCDSCLVDGTSKYVPIRYMEWGR